MEPKWSREDVQRVLYNLVKTYQRYRNSDITAVNEFMDEAIKGAIITLQDNDWWDGDRIEKDEKALKREANKALKDLATWGQEQQEETYMRLLNKLRPFKK